MMLRFTLLVVLASFLAASGACKPNHHECDTTSYGSHCDGAELVTCQAAPEGDCASPDGCDTYVTHTACATGTACTADTAARAVCQGPVAACSAGAVLAAPSTDKVHALVADVNADGRPDVVAYSASSYVVSLSNGDGTFRALPSAGIPRASRQWGDWFPLFAGDFDGDHRVDLVFQDFRSEPTVVVMLGNGDGTFREGAATAACIEQLGVGDVNGDGKDDLVDGVDAAYLGGPSGAFAQIGAHRGPGCSDDPAGFPAVADFDGDGVADVVARDEFAKGDGHGGFGSAWRSRIRTRRLQGTSTATESPTWCGPRGTWSDRRASSARAPVKRT